MRSHSLRDCKPYQCAMPVSHWLRTSQKKFCHAERCVGDSVFGSTAIPLQRGGMVGRNTAARVVEKAEVILRCRESLVRGFCVPPCGLSEITFDSSCLLITT